MRPVRVFGAVQEREVAAERGQVELAVGQPPVRGQVEAFEEVDVEVHVRARRNQREALRQGVEILLHCVRHSIHAVVVRGAVQQLEQQSIVRVHRERDRAHVQQVETVRSDDAMQGSERMFAQHVGAFHADLQRQTVIPVRTGRFEIKPEQRLRLPIPVFVPFPHDSSFQSLCHSMISI